MLIPKKDRVCIYTALFDEGVMVARKDFNCPKHHFLDVKNLYVIKSMQSLRSRGYVRENFSWMWYYYYLTDEGIEYLRNYLGIDAEVQPKSRTKKAPAPRPSGQGRFGDREERGRRPFSDDRKLGGAPGAFEPSFRRENRDRREGEGRGEGRGRGGFGGGRGGFGGGRGGFRGGRSEE